VPVPRLSRPYMRQNPHCRWIALFEAGNTARTMPS
jgi:hypothetical protein